MEYNSQRNHLRLREYGRNIQKLIEYAVSLTDKDEKQDVVDHVVQIMGNLNPHLKNVDDFNHLLWDHLHIMSDFQLTDINSPYPMPDKEVLFSKPGKFPYPEKNKRFRHYGKHVIRMIEKASALEDEEMKKEYSETIANYMKIVYNDWNRENVSDEIIIEDLVMISDGKLNLDNETKLLTVKSSGKQGAASKRKGGSGGKRFGGSKKGKKYAKRR